ncbi:MAG TPA: hypothetical protein VHM64_09895, partial [Candidatus Binatia bacterium]|nr:hypothetical protein [Candidatus Binatia bacterium]
GSGAQSPVPDSRTTDFGGMAGLSTSDSEEDGMGGGGEAGPEGEIGFGIGSLTGETASSGGLSGGLPGEGGGSFGGTAVLGDDSAANVHGNGFGGGVTSAESGVLPLLAMEGYGGGSLR